MKKRSWIVGAVIVGVLVAIGLFAAFMAKGTDKSPYFATKVDKGSIRQVVEATGTINAVTTVQVGSQVSGTIAKLLVDFNSRVKKGQIIAQIDPSLFQGALLQAKADLANAQANLVASKANLEKARATALQTKADYERTEGLTKAGVMSPQQLDLARANSDSAQAAVSAAEAQITQAAAQVKQKEAAVEVSQTNLNYTTIHAPIDGTVIARSVDVGQTVAASLQAPTLFTIAQDLTKMQVYANTDESDVGTIRPGQPVTFKVDAFPKDTFSGRVSQVRMNATVVQNVVTYNTVIDFDNPELKLFPGMAYRIELWGDQVESLSQIDPLFGTVKQKYVRLPVYPKTHYVMKPETRDKAIDSIKQELAWWEVELEKQGRLVESQRIHQRTMFDLEMIKSVGYCHGIENYSRHFTGRLPGEPPPTLLDYFGRDYLMFVDESHQTIPQLHGMYHGDRSRKQNLVEYGFRLPSALDNRPLTFEEFEHRMNQMVYVSATPGPWELTKSAGVVVEQIIRPTGLIDPPVEIRPVKGQIDDLLHEIRDRVARGERVLVTTLTKRMLRPGAHRSRNQFVSIGISDRRSRNAGRWTVTTFSRK